MYDKILNDKEYLDVMANIENIHFITSGKWDWEHGIGHAKRVTNYVKQILTYLDSDEKTIELGVIAGLLHDIGLIRGEKHEHAKYSAQLARKYLLKYNMLEADIDTIAQAIYDHTNGNDIKSKIGAALLLADKLDMVKYRVINSSIKDKMNNQIATIDDVTINISYNQITINYITNGTFDPYIFKDWNKPLLMPLRVANYLDKDLVFLINEIPYDINNVLGLSS